MFQSLGFRDHVWWPRIECFAKFASVAVFIGYALIPLGIFTRVVGADYAEKKQFELRDASLLPEKAPAGKETK